MNIPVVLIAACNPRINVLLLVISLLQLPAPFPTPGQTRAQQALGSS